MLKKVNHWNQVRELLQQLGEVKQNMDTLKVTVEQLDNNSITLLGKMISTYPVKVEVKRSGTSVTVLVGPVR